VHDLFLKEKGGVLKKEDVVSGYNFIMRFVRRVDALEKIKVREINPNVVAILFHVTIGKLIEEERFLIVDEMLFGALNEDKLHKDFKVSILAATSDISDELFFWPEFNDHVSYEEEE